MATNDDAEPWLANGRRNAAALRPGNGNGELPGEEGNGGLNQPKAQLGVMFIDEKGVPHAFQFSHLYRLLVEDGALVAEFTGHRVVMTGRGLWSPIQSSLMQLLNLHKRDIVEANVGGESRDFGQEKSWVVHSIRVEKIEEEK